MAGEPSRALEEIASRVRACTRCRLAAERMRAVPGEGPADARVVLVGEAPGRDEDASGRPFVGRAGQVLNEALASCGLRRGSVFITNLVKCRPPGNRRPRADEIEACRPYLVEQLAVLRPEVVVSLGATSLHGLRGPSPAFPEARGHLMRLGETLLLPTYHPAAVLYNRSLREALRKDLRKAGRRASGSPVRSGPPRAGKPARRVVSAGAAVVDGHGRLLLLHRADERRWCLPKGRLESGETLEAAAVREVREETGLEVRLAGPLATVRYRFYWPPDRANVDKEVAYFLARRVGGKVVPEPGFDRSRWAGRGEAMRLLRFPNDREVATQAFEAAELAANRKTRGPVPAATR